MIFFHFQLSEQSLRFLNGATGFQTTDSYSFRWCMERLQLKSSFGKNYTTLLKPGFHSWGFKMSQEAEERFCVWRGWGSTVSRNTNCKYFVPFGKVPWQAGICPPPIALQWKIILLLLLVMIFITELHIYHQLKFCYTLSNLWQISYISLGLWGLLTPREVELLDVSEQNAEILFSQFSLLLTGTSMNDA